MTKKWLLILLIGFSLPAMAVEYKQLSCEGIDQGKTQIRFEQSADNTPVALFQESGSWVEHKIISQDNAYIVVEAQKNFDLENARKNQCFSIPLPACSYNYRFEREISPYAASNTIYASMLSTNRCSYSTDFDCKILERNQVIPHGTATCIIIE